MSGKCVGVLACWVFFVLIVAIVTLLAYLAERKAWNRGRCDRCGAPWVNFAMDSQGGRGYCCRNHSHTHYGPWISYPYIDRPSKVIQ